MSHVLAEREADKAAVRYFMFYLRKWAQLVRGATNRGISIHYIILGPLYLLLPLSAGVSPDVLTPGSSSAPGPSLTSKSNIISQ